LSSADQGRWAWRAKLTWALLGPSIVLLIQVEAVLVIADALGALNLRVDAARWSAAIALGVLVLVIAAQLSTGLWRRARDARTDLLDRRLYAEADPGRGLLDGYGRDFSPRRFQSWMRNVMDLLPDVRIRGFPPRRYYPGDYRSKKLETIAWRFGLEPTWAYRMLDELGNPAARHLTRQTQLLDARAAGDTTALAVAVASLAGAVVVVVPLNSAARWAVVVVIALLAVARGVIIVRSKHEFLKNEEQFYPRLERLLELHRFDLYRALDVEVPRDTHEERDQPLAKWRQGRGDVRYALPEASGDSDVREQVQGLTDLLRGPELVGYEGYISWEVREDRVLLVFAKTPVPEATSSASFQVEGSGAESYAPFDISANSEDVVLTQVRKAVHAPVDGRPVRVSFDLTLRPAAARRRAPVIWFEIRQRGRFLQLLRVSADAGAANSAAPPAQPGLPGPALGHDPTSA